MSTECIGKRIEFQGLSGRRVVGRFDGGLITSDGGGLLLREVIQGIPFMDGIREKAA